MDSLENRKYKVVWLNSFKHELSQVYYYLSQILKEPSTANKFHKKVYKILSTLSYFPERSPEISFDKNIRKISIDKYIILYTINHDTRTSLHFTYFSWKSKLFKQIIIKYYSNQI